MSLLVNYKFLECNGLQQVQVQFGFMRLQNTVTFQNMSHPKEKWGHTMVNVLLGFLSRDKDLDVVILK